MEHKVGMRQSPLPRSRRTLSRRCAYAVILTSCLQVSSCGDTGANHPTVEVLRPPPPPDMSLRLERAVRSTEEIVFFQVGDVLISEDGALIVSNAGTHSLVFVDTDGVPRRTVGRRGSGPGEFENLTSVRPAEGDFVVWDQQLRHLTTFSRDGALRRVVKLEPSGAWRLITAWNGSAVLVKPPSDESRVRTYAVVDSTGVVAQVWERSGRERGVVSYPSRHPVTGAPGRTVAILPACMPETLEVGLDSVVFSIDTAEGTVQQQLNDGSNRIIYRSPYRTRFGPAARQRIEADIHAAVPETVASALRRAGYPDGYLPVWQRAMAGDDLIFLERATCAPGTHSRTWDVITRNGTAVGSFALPSDHHLRGVSRELFAVVAVDSFEVEYLQLYRPVPPLR